MHKWEDWNNDTCWNHIHHVLTAMRGLYDSEINCCISTFWDGGYVAKLGDVMNGFDDSKEFDYLEDAMDWLIHRAVEIYPNSDYAHKFKRGLFS